MRVLLLSDINSSHTQKWAVSLAAKGIEIGIFSLRELNTNVYNEKQNIKVYTANYFKNIALLKFSYLMALPLLKKIIKEFKPDIIHAHYASSYGLLGALSGFHPFIMSVWGSDIFDFPGENPFYKYLLKFNLDRADNILSTSKVLAIETSKYTNKNIAITPFGIDLEKFKPSEEITKEIVVGTIKMLEEKYGIKYLIKAFAILKKRLPQLPLKLRIVGGGSL